jgi:rhodanese-related sulfurtransferase
MKIIDVRTMAEYNSGHVPGSINIPLSEIAAKVEEVKNMNQRIILCCASGNRSEQATNFLKSYGVDCENGGSWIEVLNLEIK